MSFTMPASAVSMRFCSSWILLWWVDPFAKMVASDSMAVDFTSAFSSCACVCLLHRYPIPFWRNLGRHDDAASHPYLTGALGVALLSSFLVLACFTVSMALSAVMFTSAICCLRCFRMVLRVSAAALFADALDDFGDACCGCVRFHLLVLRFCVIIIHWLSVAWCSPCRAALRRPIPLAVPRKAYTFGLG